MKKWGGGQKSQKNDDVFYEWPLYSNYNKNPYYLYSTKRSDLYLNHGTCINRNVLSDQMLFYDIIWNGISLQILKVQRTYYIKNFQSKILSHIIFTVHKKPGLYL